jgi:hypothetical protein
MKAVARRHPNYNAFLADLSGVLAQVSTSAKRITGESVDEVKRKIEAGAERLRADLLGLLATWKDYHARFAVQSRNINIICESATDVHAHLPTTAPPQEAPQERHMGNQRRFRPYIPRDTTATEHAPTCMVCPQMHSETENQKHLLASPANSFLVYGVFHEAHDSVSV